MRIKKVSKISKNLTKTRIHLKSQAKKFDEYKTKKSSIQGIKAYIENLKLLAKTYRGGKLNIENSLKYVDEKRIQRAKTQLKVFFIQSIKNKHIFRFVVKSSGLNPPQSYYVDVMVKDVELSALKGIDYKDILLKNPIKTQCSCDDFRYRFRYWLTKMGSCLGVQEHRFPKKTNPHTEHKFLCKHQTLVLNGMKKPSFMTIFKRYVDNILDEKEIRITEKDREKTQIASHRIKRYDNN